MGPGVPGLRVGVVTHYMPPHLGGIELFAEALCRGYRATGLDVTWVASRVPPDAPPREPGRVRVACWNWPERRLGVPWPVWSPAGAREVARLVRWADVLHIHDCLYPGSVLATVFAHRARKPILLSQHIGFVRYPGRLLNAIERVAYWSLGRAVLRRAARVVCCTPAAEAFVSALWDGASQTTVTIPYGIDTHRFRPPGETERLAARRALGLPGAASVVLFVGRLVEKKGADLFLEVCRQTPAQHFLMVGDGHLAPAAAPPTNLTWHPVVAPADMAQVYQAADVLVLPSHGEGFPFVVIEAMACGLPVIVSKGEAFTEVLEHEAAGLAADRTPAALRDALARLGDTPGLRAALAARGRALVAERWSWESVERRYVALIRELAGRG